METKRHPMLAEESDDVLEDELVGGMLLAAVQRPQHTNY